MNLIDIVIFKNVDFSYADKNVFKNLNLEIKKEDFIGIAGQTGSGKTTLINLIMGLIKSDFGTIHFNNNEDSFLGFELCDNVGT